VALQEPDSVMGITPWVSSVPASVKHHGSHSLLVTTVAGRYAGGNATHCCSRYLLPNTTDPAGLRVLHAL